MQRWKLSALAAATLALTGMTASNAWALALGRITVQSALGEPLRAEVEIPQLSAAEADSLRAAVASPEAFRAQGVEYTGTANAIRVKVVKHANGSAVLQLSSVQPVNDPFLDLVLDANWASGKLQRNYTLLLDPPVSRRAAPGVTAAAQASAPEAPRTRPGSPAVVAQTRAPEEGRQPAPRKPAPVAVAARAQDSSDEVRVKPGDTAGRLASAHHPAGVSLDQMLVAMLRANPHAFINGNINRMRSGVVIQVPDEAAAKATPQNEARRIMAAQSRDFNQFRRQLAGAAPAAPVEAASRAASGQVQAHVEETKPGTAAPDKLTLSKGAVKGVAADEKLAQQKQSADQSSRMDELKRNMAELSQIASATKPEGAAASAATGSSAAAAAAGVAVPAAAPAAADKPAEPAAAPTAAPGAAPQTEQADNKSADAAKPAEPAAEAAAAAAPAAAPAPQPKPASAPAPVPQEPSFIDSLMEDPTIPLAGAAILALLLGYGGYRVAQRRKAAAAVADSALGDSQLAADSFFGSSGGQHVDTGTSSQMSGHSMQYSPSQLDAGDVDPLAEADVYLAYGRDLQAEEILKEALRTDPSRPVLHQKLAEIYVKRHDRKAFEATAQTLRGLTQGQGPEWQRLVEQGRILDPENALYQQGGNQQPAAAQPQQAMAGGMAAAGAAALGFGAALAQSKLETGHEAASTPPAGLNMDLGLPGGLADAEPVPKPGDAPATLSADRATPGNRSATPSAPSSTTPEVPSPSASLPEQPKPLDPGNGLAMDFASFSAAPAAQPPAASLGSAGAETAAAAPSIPESLEFDLSDFTLPTAQADAGAKDTAKNAAVDRLAEDDSAASDAMEFDLGALSLDLGSSTPASSPSAPTAPEDPLATKLALAEEFNAIGDSDGARTLIEEVIAEARGDLKVQAERLLSEIG
ncbi:motility protein FimV [Comamonas phosphati]|nr:motility protein FimV [Comamonas phosphati]